MSDIEYVSWLFIALVVGAVIGFGAGAVAMEWKWRRTIDRATRIATAMKGADLDKLTPEARHKLLDGR
jgi:hypothetical protein